MISFWFLFGGIFFLVGLIITVVFAGIFSMMPGSGFGTFLILPVAFMLLGLGVLIHAFRLMIRKRNVSKKGTRYPAKIYGYVEDTSYTVNDAYTVNVKVRFFDRDQIEREAILATNFPKNSDMYGIGMTIDIFEYQGQYDYDRNSLRYERIPGEEELMDDKPVAPAEASLTAVSCPNCGASFSAMKGYANKCPYCGGYLNV